MLPVWSKAQYGEINSRITLRSIRLHSKETPLKILVVGGTGDIGKAVVNKLSPKYNIIVAGRTHGDLQVDIADPASITSLYKKIGKLDAVISTTGHAHFAPLQEMDLDLYEIGLQNKLMGQINLVLTGLKYIADGGSFTLTAGILNQYPILGGTSAAICNGGLEGFVRSAAIDMPRHVRINLVSPTVLAESYAKFGSAFEGFEPVSGSEVAEAFMKSVAGEETGMVYRVGYHL